MKGIYITDDVVIYNDMEIGWSQGKYQPRWHHKVYDMWRDTWRRVYGHINYFGSLIHPSFKYLSNYVKWIEEQPRFNEFCKTCNKTMWSIDKDLKYPNNRYYYPEYMTLTTQSENTKERINRNGSPNRTPKKPVIGIPLDVMNKIVFTISIKDVRKYGFDKGNVSKCLSKIYKTHKGYKWYKLSYRHNKKYRIKESI